MNNKFIKLNPFWFACFILIQFFSYANAQLSKPSLPDSLFTTYYHQRVSHFRTLPQTKGDIIFIGNSITDGGEWSELFNDKRIKNRGICGDVTTGVINRIDEITERKPAKVFLMTGVNDLARNSNPDSVVKNSLWIAGYIHQQSPATKVYIQSILPVNDIYGKFGGHTNKGPQIKKVNEQLQKNATDYRYTYVDLYTFFSDENGKLKPAFTNDGLHLKGEAYLLWKHLVYPYIYDLQAKPSLIPLPQQLTWKEPYFPLYAAKTIIVKSAALKGEGEKLQQLLIKKGLPFTISNEAKEGEPFIELQIDKAVIPQSNEGYRLKVDGRKVVISSNSGHGVFNGIQTLSQLMRDDVIIDGCDITDWPSFSWRGYMVDVGRNFQSLTLLKQQIEIMSRYKLNVFHLHLTEDIAWRVAIKQYPQLTAPETMLRDKGLYYSEGELKELILFCKERYITFVPEIDMPGHSAAFTRALGVEMQSDSGLHILKNILREFCATYHIPYLHIGGDEVKITNKKLLPEVTELINSLGAKTIGWEPGGNLSDKTIRQLWMSEGAKDTSLIYIDSRHLYLNHMDPLEGVVTIFNRQLGDGNEEDKNVVGGTLCLWHDRSVANETDVVKMNLVYPAMLAFSERSWRGGGHKGWLATIGEPASARALEFELFENRLMDHKEQYFSVLPFPYAKQSSLVWSFYGPYFNKGDSFKKFDPEGEGFNEKPTVAFQQVVGGTIVLRHWWHPLVQGLIKDPKEASTWYATTRIWSDEDKTEDFWIGFNNLSRSPATDSPKPGTWDNRQSKLWVNGQEIAPPVWKRGGQKGHPEIPLTDEGYEYREPTKISLRKGWNDVLVKLPVSNFKAVDWHNPVKWMFTFVEAPE